MIYLDCRIHRRCSWCTWTETQILDLLVKAKTEQAYEPCVSFYLILFGKWNISMLWSYLVAYSPHRCQTSISCGIFSSQMQLHRGVDALEQQIWELLPITMPKKYSPLSWWWEILNKMNFGWQNWFLVQLIAVVFTPVSELVGFKLGKHMAIQVIVEGKEERVKRGNGSTWDFVTFPCEVSWRRAKY